MEGLFRINYSVKRIFTEVVFRQRDPLYSQIFKLIILPIAFVTSLPKSNIDTPIPKGAGSLASEIDRRTYSITELQDKYDIEETMKINELFNLNE